MNNINVLLVNSRSAKTDPVRSSLERISDYGMQIDHVHTHSCALKSFRQNNHDLVFIEHELNQGSGKLLARTLIDQENSPPIVIFTKNGDEQTCAMYFRMGVADYYPEENMDRNRLRSLIKSTVVDRTTNQGEPHHRMSRLNLQHSNGYIISRINEEMSSAVRHNKHLSICLMNLETSIHSNAIPRVNASEHLLGEVRHEMQAYFREEDLVGRFGADNFIFVLRHTDSIGAFRTAKELKNELRNTSFSTHSDGPIELNVFFGLAELNGYRFSHNKDCEDVKNFVNRAEKTLRLAKRQDPGTIERRRYRRFPVDPAVPINVELYDHQETAHLLNLSRNGARLGHGPFLREGQHLTLKVETAQEDRVMRRGTVRTCQQRSNTSKAVLGVELQKHWPQNLISQFRPTLQRKPAQSSHASATNDF